jgi:SPP1 Gp6-like portal protein
MTMSAGVVRGLCLEFFGDFLATRKRTQILDSWTRGEQAKVTSGDWRGSPYVPEDANPELKAMSEIAPNGFGDLIITSLAQTAYVDGVRLPGTEDNMDSWNVWQENRWDAKQISLHRATIGHGLAYGLALPAKSRVTKTKTAKMQAISAIRMSAWYDEDDDEFPLHAILADPVKNDALNAHVGEWTVRVYDESAVYYLSCVNNGKELRDWTFISYEEHGLDVPPVVRYANRIDLDGRATGVIEPVIPLLRRLDQDTFDRIIVQRFGAWKVRWIAGMAKPTSEEAAAQEAIKLSLMDLLISTNENTKFGTLDATDMAGYIASADTDLRYLAAITQTPPHHLLGLSSNLQAEALAAAEKGLQSKSIDFKTIAGEAHEQMFRLVAQIMGNTKEATATGMKVRWRDTESRSLVQTANALTLLASGLGIPSEMLWERLPGWDDADSERAIRLIESGNVDQLLATIAGNQATEQAVAVAKAKPSDNGGQGGSDNAPKK